MLTLRKILSNFKQNGLTVDFKALKISQMFGVLFFGKSAVISLSDQNINNKNTRLKIEN